MLPSADESCTELLYATCGECVSSVLRIRARFLLLLETEQASGLRTRSAILALLLNEPGEGAGAAQPPHLPNRPVIILRIPYKRFKQNVTYEAYGGIYDTG